MKAIKFVGIGVLVVAFLGVGLMFAQGPQPEIIVPGEVITTVGPLNISNTLITSWTVMAFLIIFSIIATRSVSLVPGGIQNFVEGVLSFLIGQMEEIAGEEKARRFFPVIATIFIYIIVSNWAGLLPFFAAVGKTEDMGTHIAHEIFNPHPHDLVLGEDGTYEEDEHFGGWEMYNSGGITMTKSGSKIMGFHVHAGDTPEETLDRHIVFLAHHFTDFEATEDDLDHPSHETVIAAAAALESTDGAPKLIMGHAEEGDDHATESKDDHAASGEESEHHALVSPALGTTIEGIDWVVADKKMALVIPFFRGTFSDINNTLAMGIVAFIMIEFWGFQALGFGYLKKFFNLNGINSFVGILELLSEFIRVISFAFRLFGNIFAGEVLILMLTFLMPFLFVDAIYMLELFVGFIQASVFALLVLVFGSMATESHGEHDHEEGHGDSHGHGHEPDAHGAHPVGAAQH